MDCGKSIDHYYLNELTYEDETGLKKNNKNRSGPSTALRANLKFENKKIGIATLSRDRQSHADEGLNQENAVEEMLEDDSSPDEISDEEQGPDLDITSAEEPEHEIDRKRPTSAAPEEHLTVEYGH